ncbi:uncharacterized protein [Fopius arisanus]|uniref:Uncharacterized protein n=1 Tax=Fopius arisanus TaxID=64838 RepID=A0A9R1TDF2_9HYME|nr:PREDICTED: uncharacterized protein LOC105269562 [Fopius arisanus]
MARQGIQWFNAHIFSINGKPMKFYLDGFDLVEFYRIIKIVEAYGGKFSEPGEDVVVFSRSHGSSKKYDNLFHVNFLSDSIASNNTQDPMKYTLSPNAKISFIHEKGSIVERNVSHCCENHNKNCANEIRGTTNRTDQQIPSIVPQLDPQVNIKLEIDSKKEIPNLYHCMNSETRKRHMEMRGSNCYVLCSSLSKEDNHLEVPKKYMKTSAEGPRTGGIPGDRLSQNFSSNSHEESLGNSVKESESDSWGEEAPGCARVRIYEAARISDNTRTMAKAFDAVPYGNVTSINLSSNGNSSQYVSRNNSEL